MVLIAFWNQLYIYIFKCVVHIDIIILNHVSHAFFSTKLCGCTQGDHSLCCSPHCTLSTDAIGLIDLTFDRSAWFNLGWLFQFSMALKHFLLKISLICLLHWISTHLLSPVHYINMIWDNWLISNVTPYCHRVPGNKTLQRQNVHHCFVLPERD